MKVRVVLYESSSWIISKFAEKLRAELVGLGVEVDVASKRDPNADFNHHLVYIDVIEQTSGSDTLMVTHVDDVASLRLLRRQLRSGATGICVSSDTRSRLVHMGLPSDRLCYILPAHDGDFKPRAHVVGITTRLYPQDGRKREGWLLRLASEISPDEFRFVIMGSGWGRIVQTMRAEGFEVEYHTDFARDSYLTVMQSIDYYLYLSTDEGSMGFVDALAAGIPTIATPQGFHLDAAGGLTHPFTTFRELVEVFGRIAESRRKLAASVANWTWGEYARKHCEVWEYLRSGTGPSEIVLPDGIASLGAEPAQGGDDRVAFASELIRGSLQHTLVSGAYRAHQLARTAVRKLQRLRGRQ
jgi:hypothetical protein